ncbi:MAG: tRNA (N(6)-L-threonylcarbamoyladenosine(37)-C(2))-methylthiotransferase MtaB [Planctomycetes bacterium]|jgi:threonylcarbamoyladenosine tRNA methylthiotransferase MtaB|nr:tRNA (N(6)-L-threonylcarbamoyladenosine(37)-C(2))-methylthiotransferase MtaB [Planctomycetota bacterium]
MLCRFAIFTLGCKANQYESQQIRQLLESFGLAPVDSAHAPQLVVINTCCVTHTASAKSRHLIRQARRDGPATVVICGCLPAVETNELKALGENVHVVKNRCDLAAVLSRLVHTESTAPDPVPPGPRSAEAPRCSTDTFIRPQSDAKVKFEKDLCLSDGLPSLTSFQNQTRAFLKVQDGCDAFCTYCIIPTARPVVRYRNSEEILAEAAALVTAGHKEIVITGVHLGSYGQITARRRHWPTPDNPHLPALLDRVAQVPGLSRIRLSSLDPADVTPALLDVFCAHPNLLPHLHLSLQSGSDAVLRRMARSYTADDFRSKVALVRSRLDRPALTTDIIVGFPGETDAEFEETLALTQEVAFAKMHIFVFSARKGTAAARMQPKVASEVKKARSRTLRDLDLALQRQFRAQFLGETAQILIETTNGSPSGRAERYFEVRIADRTYRTDRTNKTFSPGDIIAARLQENAADSILATSIGS